MRIEMLQLDVINIRINYTIFSVGAIASCIGWRPTYVSSVNVSVPIKRTEKWSDNGLPGKRKIVSLLRIISMNMCYVRYLFYFTTLK